MRDLMLGGRVLPRVIVVVAVLAIGGLIAKGSVFGLFEDPESNFAATQPLMVEDYGEDAEVVSIASEGDLGVTYEVAGEDGKVQIKDYEFSSETGRNSQGQSTEDIERNESEATRRAGKRELERATITLGQLDPEVLVGIAAELETRPETMKAVLIGEQWQILKTGTLEDFSEISFDPEQYTANYDGTGIQRVKGAPDQLELQSPRS
jgi:hypothetical protein